MTEMITYHYPQPVEEVQKVLENYGIDTAGMSTQEIVDLVNARGLALGGWVSVTGRRERIESAGTGPPGPAETPS
jgi:hypothetical protein